MKSDTLKFKSIPKLYTTSFVIYLWLPIISLFLESITGVGAVQNNLREGLPWIPNSSVTTSLAHHHRDTNPLLQDPRLSSSRMKRHTAPTPIELCNTQLEEVRGKINELKRNNTQLKSQLQVVTEDANRLGEENGKLRKEFQFQLSTFSQSEKQTCAVIYSQQKYQGQYFTLNDKGQTINIPEDIIGWNTTGSLRIRVENNCNLRLCSGVNFQRECGTLPNGLYLDEASMSLNLTVITSASCSCEKECRCSDNHMKKSSCARGYLRKGSNNYNSLYIDLLGNEEFLDEQFVGNVTAFRIRKGCNLTIYSEVEFEGETTTFSEEEVDNYQGEFLSYECECDDTKFVTSLKPPRPASYPPLIDIPERLELKMLNESQFSTHPGLQAAHMSLRNGRSSKNVYVLFMGSSGSGKSSAINILLDNVRTFYSCGTTTNSEIVEYKIPVPIDELGAQNSELRLIEIPGLSDTRGLQQDAATLTALNSYLSNHEELKDKIPNVVLVFHKFNDNRFNGGGSNFVKILRGLASFRNRITDENYSNVIFVFSHFTSETRRNQIKPQFRLASFKRVIEEFSLFPKPITMAVAENKAREQGLPMVNGHFKLPNNEYYPRNLFEKMELVTQNGGDMMGLEAIRSTLCRRDHSEEDFNVTYCKSYYVESRNKSQTSVDYYMNIFNNKNNTALD